MAAAPPPPPRQAMSVRHPTPAPRILAGLSSQEETEIDIPTFLRRGIDISIQAQRESEKGDEKIDKADPDKPAFLRKIMD